MQKCCVWFCGFPACQQLTAESAPIMSALKKLTRLKGLPKAVVEILQQHDITTCKDILDKSPLELMTILGYTYPHLEDLIKIVSRGAAPKSENVLSLCQRSKDNTMPTSLSTLDSLLRGGIPAGMITEIGGPAGCGKTQFCIMLTVVTALSSNVVYIDTEGAFTAERLMEIAKHRYPSSSSSEDLLGLASRVNVFKPLTCEMLLDQLTELEETVIEKSVKLVIVDSIASLVRKEFDASSRRGVSDRAALLGTHAARLKYIAESFRIPILVTNQITTKVGCDGEVEDSSVVIVALGNSWSHAVNVRILMQYREGISNKRMLTVSKSPLCHQASFVVSIQDKGLVIDLEATGKLSIEKSLDPQLISLVSHSSIDSLIMSG